MDERSMRIQSRFELPGLAAALLVVPVIAVQQSSAGEGWQRAADVADWAIWSVFALELGTMLAVVPERRRYLREHLLDVAIVLLTPPFLPGNLGGLRLFRLLRLLRLLRVVEYARRGLSLQGAQLAGVFALLTAIGGGAAFSAAEGRQLSTWDGIYWAVTTMTTVGYGDIYPHTTLGRVISMSVMLVGIGFIATLTATLAERFLAYRVQREAETVEAELVEEIEEAQEELEKELQDVVRRLQDLEGLIRRLRASPGSIR